MTVSVPRTYVRHLFGIKPVAYSFHFVAFGENLVITAHASKTEGDWWYGTVVSSGKAGFFPKTYVQTFETGK
jgi:hypothetical protein